MFFLSPGIESDNHVDKRVNHAGPTATNLCSILKALLLPAVEFVPFFEPESGRPFRSVQR